MSRTLTRPPHRTSSLRRVVVALATAGLLASLAACSSNASEAATATGAGAQTLTPLVAGGPWNGAAGKDPVLTGAFGYAVATGIAEPILADHGFTYDSFVGFNNGPPVVKALQTGDIQLGFIGDTPATQAKGSGIDVPALVVAKPSSDIWFLTKTGGVTTIEELAGKKIGLQFGSNFDKYGRAVLNRHGVGDSVECVNLLFADALPALQRGDIDAVPVPATTAGIWRAVNDFPVLSKASEDDPDLLATSVVLTSRETLDANSELAAAIWAVTKAGNAKILEDTDAYAQWLSDATGSPIDIINAAELWSYATEAIDPDGLATIGTTLDFLVEQGTVPEAFDVDSWVVR